MNNKLKKILSSTLAVTLATATMFTTGIVVNATELPNVENTTNAEGNVVVTQTENPTEYTTVAEKVEEALPEVSAEPILNVNSVEEIDSKDTVNETSDSVLKSCRLIITNPTDLEFKEESLGVDNIVSVQKYEDKYFVTYRSVYATEKAYNDLTALGLDVEIDVVQDTPEGVEIKDDRGNDIENKEIIPTEETRPTKSVEDVVIEDTQKNERTIVVAVLDTGLNNDEAIFEDKVVEGKNFVSEQSDVKDLDGHGTTMSRIILESVNEENTNNAIKVMPIKVLNDEGKGTTLSAYKGIKYVIEKKKENPSLDFVINLSMSGIGHSKLLESAINEAYNNNIPVVVSAGNDNKDVSEYTPANIDSAFTIASAEKNNNVIEKTLYSNFGANVDYSANGHYEYIRNIYDKEVVTKVDGTSVSSAYVSSYVAMLKQMALSDDNEDNDNLSIVDIDASLSESAISVDTTLGRGYLAKENIHLKRIEEEEALPVISNNSNEALPVEDVSNVDENITLTKNVDKWVFARSGTNYAFSEDINNQLIAAIFGDHATNVTVHICCPIFFNQTVDCTGFNLTLNGYGNPFYPAVQYFGVVRITPITIGTNGNLTLNDATLDGRGGENWSFIKNSEVSQVGGFIDVVHGVLTCNRVNIQNIKNHRTATGDWSKPLGGGTGVNFKNSNLTFNNCNFTGLSGCAIYQFDSDLSGNVTLNSCGCSNVSELYSQTDPDITWNHTLTINGGNYYIGYCDGVSQNYVTYQGGIAVGNGKNSGQHKVDITNATIIAGRPSGGWGSALSMYDVTRGCKIKNSTIKGKPSIEANRNTYVTIDNSTIDSFASNSSYVYSNGINVGSNADKRTCTLSLINNSKVYSPEIGINNFGTTSINKSLVSAFQVIVNEAGLCTLNISNTSKIIGAKNTPGKGDYAVFTSGIINKGVTNISNSTVKDCMSGIINYGNMFEGINISTTTITNSTISNEIGIENYGMCNFNSGQITNCYYGVQNQEGSTFNQNGGNIYNNGYPTNLSQNNCSGDNVNIGILQDGTYNYSAGYIANNSVKLGANKTINLVGNVQNSIVLTTALNDRKVGRALVSANNTNLANANESKFKLAFAQPVKDSDGAGFSGKGNSGAVRTGSRIPYVDDSKMVLSGMYKVNYNGKRDDAQSIFSYNPSDNFFYWLEPVNEIGLAEESKVVKVTSWEPYEETDLSAEGTGDYEFMGWCEKADGSDTIYKEIRTEWLAKNKPYYAIYRRGKAKVTYNPNGAVDENGDKYNTVTDENSTSIYSDYDLQSGSTFGTLQEEEKYIVVDKKGTNDIVDNAYYKVKKGDITNNLGKKTKMYSFQGWSVVDYADHTAEEILYGGTLPFIDLVSDFNAVLDKGYQTKPNNKTLKSIVNEIKERSKYYNSGKLVKWNEEFDNNGIVNMYATWDEYPEINAKELVFTERQFNNVTEEDLLKKLTATDKEDGDITKKVKILNFDDVVKTLNALNTTAATTVTYEVTDSAGNTTRAYAEVWRNSDTPLEVSDPEHTAHIRSICRQAYDTHDPKNGGCMKDSLWYNDPEYVQVMLTGFDNMENDTPIKSYTYTKEDRERISAFVDEHGIGNSLEPDGLKKYHAIFGTSEYETQNRMDILIDGNDEDSSITILGFEFKWNDKELNQLRKKKDQARIERLRNKIAQASNPQA